MKIICPNLKNKEVAREFEELKNATSEAAAYHIWSQNNGNSIDKAPNGEPSKLFSDLLEHYNGDRVAAIQAKARTYSESFRDWFGDWTNTIKPGNIIFGHPAIGKTYSLESGKYKDKLIDWDEEFNTKRDKWIEDHSNTVKGTPEYKKARNEYLIYPERHPDYVEFIKSEWERVKNKVKKEGKILFASPHNLLKMFPQDFNRIINLKDDDFIKRNIGRGGKEKESKLWKEGINETISNTTGIPVEYLNENQYFEDYLNKHLGISKVVDENGEPLIVYHGTRTSDGIEKEGFSSNMSGKGNRGANQGYFYFSNNYENAEYTGVKNEEIEPLIDLITSVYDMFDTTKLPSIKELYTIIDDLIKEKRKINDNIRNLKEDSIIKKLIKPILKLTNKDYKSSKELKEQYRNTINEIDIELEELDTKIKNIYNLNLGLDYLKGDRSKTSVNTLYFIKSSINSKSPYRQIAANKLINILYGTKNLKYSPKVFPVYLNIKNPLSSDFGMKETDKNPLKSGPFSEDYILYNNLESGLLKELTKPEYDGSISRNKFDILFGDVYIAKHSNQIKSIDNQGTFSTQDNNIYLADSNSENTSQLESMQSYSNSKELLDNMDSEMATVLNDVAAKINMQPVSIEYTDRPLNEVYPEATYWTPAIYDRNANKIVVNRNGDFSRYGSLENVLLHEIAHAITLDSLASNTEAANELRKIQKEYAEKYEDHASKNVYEFAAELFSNPEVIHNMFDFPATKGEKTLIQKIIDWFKRLFGKNTTHQDLINKIVDNVIEFNAYQTLEQREDSYDYIPDVLPAASKREEIASIKLRSVFSDMVKTAENRVASLRYNVIEDKFDRNENLRNDKLLSSLRSIQNSITDVEGVNNIANFLNGSLEYVDNVLYSLDEAEKVIKTIDEKISTAQITNDTEELTKLRTALDNFGAEYLYPHESNLRKLYNELNTEFNRNIYENILGTNEFDNILSVVDGLIREFSSKKMIDRENIGYMYGNSVRRTVEKFLRTEMEEAKDPNIDRALMNWLTFDGDLNWYHRFFATPVNSPKFVIKLLRKVIGDVNSMTHKQVYRKYAALYNAAKETRDHNLLFERDVDGKKTGYLIRDRRYGVYQNNKYKFRKDWLKNHKLASIDELKLNPSLWIQYQKDYNDWKSENCERKYTPEFYAIFTNLSMEANMALSEVNLEIDNILKPYRDSSTNKPRFERMPIDEYQKYIRLLEKKRNLANPYDPITGELKPEGSVEAQIAAELTEAYAKLQEGLESKVDMDAFLEEMERMKNVEGYTPDGSDTLYSAWLERNTRWELTDEFKEKVSKQNKKDYGEIYDRLYQARYNLLRLYRTDKFEPDYTRMPQAVKDKIKELDIAMYNVRKRTKKTVGSVRLFKSELSDLAKENGGKSAVSPEDIWVDDKGVKHYASYMTKVIPVRQQYMHRVPNSNWAETSEESKFYNKNYDNSIPEAEQPKLSIKEYDNRKAYNAVMRDPALVNLRNVILDVMNEANDKITHSNYKNNYKLPQINGNIFNYWGSRGLITGTRNYMVDAFGIQPDDEIHGVKVETRPNGTEINIMPTMYTTMLTDPASGTNDLIGAITKYYRMACNYENKKKVAPQLNLLDSLITNAGSIRQKGFTKPAASSKLADAVHTYIGYHIYGRRDILPEVTLKGYKISLDKVFEYFSRWGRDIGLSWNLRSAISGGVAAWSFYANDAFVRKHYNMHDFTIANSILTKELISLKVASQFGKNQANNKLIGVLEYNGLTFNQEEDLSNTNRWRIGRMITRATEPYAAFKLMSFLPNSVFAVSVYLNYKLIRLEDGQLHFISENDFLDNHFLNKSIEERKAIYRNAKDNLWNAYEMKDGFRVKSKYAPYVTAELEEEITAKLGSISSHAEGMVEEADKSGVHLLPALSTILMFRAFIPKNIENTISPMYWNYQTKELSMGTASAYFYGWKYGSDRKLIKLLRVLTGRNDEKLKELQEQYPDVDVKKQIDLHIRRFNAQMFTYFFWLTIFNLFGMGADDDDYWFTQFLRLELKKISLESGSRYNAMDIFDILNSITPLTQTFEDINRVINPLSYLSSRKYEEIERGAYKGLKGWQRDFIKVIPILNAYYNMKNPREKLNDMINRIG